MIWISGLGVFGKEGLNHRVHRGSQRKTLFDLTQCLSVPSVVKVLYS